MSTELQAADNYSRTALGLTLNDEATVEEAKQLAEEIADRAANGLMYLGDLYNECVRLGFIEHGKKSDWLAQIVEKHGFKNSTLRNAAWTMKTIDLSRRRDNLRYSHYNEIACLPSEEIDEAIERAADEGWTKAQTRQYVQQKKREAITHKVELPTGTFDVLYADPPWAYNNNGFEMSAANKYETLPAFDENGKDIAMYTDDYGKAIQDIVADNAVCFMWVTNPLLKDGIGVLESWGFEYKTNFCWVKDNHTAGFYVYGQHEILMVGVRGSKLPPGEKFKSVVYGKNIQHSRKPEDVYDMIERMYPNSRYCEAFTRRPREGWEGFGNEV